MMIESLSISTAFMIGLLGGVHCVGMCGGIVHALSFALSDDEHPLAKRLLILLLYNSGRVVSYSVIGAMFGSLGWFLQETIAPATIILRVLAGCMLIAMGLYLAGWWFGLLRLESLGGYLWRYFQPLATQLVPVSRLHQALILGLIWGWLPCGLVYSTLVLALAQGDWQRSALLMLSFGFGTLPVMLMSGVMAVRLKSWLQQTGVRRVAGLAVILFGLWTLVAVLLPGGHSHASMGGLQSHQQP